MSVVAILAIGWFLVSRFSVPMVGVFQPFPENVGRAVSFTFKDDFDVLAKRFVFRANLEGETFDTLFLLPKSGLKQSATIPLSKRCFPLTIEKHSKEIKKTTELLGLTDSEKAELQKSIERAHEPFLVKTGASFEYMNTRNRFLRGRGIFYLKEFGEPGIGCLIIPSSFSTLNQDFEHYHNSLRGNLKDVLSNLLKDEKFKNATLKIFRAENVARES